MKHTFKYSVLALALTLGISSCTDDYDYDAPSKVAENTPGVQFEEAASRTAVGVEDNSFDITLTRNNTTGELTVPLIAETSDVINVPSTAKFADGSDETTITVTLGEGVELCKKYDLKISIPEEYTDPYDEANGGFISYATKVIKEDYQPYAAGYYTESFFYGQSWNETLEYSQLMGMYRLPDLYANGYHVYFKWDGGTDENQSFQFCDEEGNKATSFELGFTYSSYGMVSASVISGAFAGYEEGTFYFPWNMTVSAGSFGGGYYFSYTITEKY